MPISHPAMVQVRIHFWEGLRFDIINNNNNNKIFRLPVDKEAADLATVRESSQSVRNDQHEKASLEKHKAVGVGGSLHACAQKN